MYKYAIQPSPVNSIENVDSSDHVQSISKADEQKPDIPHAIVDFVKRIDSSDSAELILEDDLRHVGFIRNLNERLYLHLLKKFLKSPKDPKDLSVPKKPIKQKKLKDQQLTESIGQTIKRFNFEKNFYSASFLEFKYLIRIIARNKPIERLEIGNNIIPASLMVKLANALAKHTNLIELSLRMHWPAFACMHDNMPFIPLLANAILKLHKLEKLDLSYNHIDSAGLSALAEACEQHRELIEVEMSGVIYVNLSPKKAYDFWFRIQAALARNKAFLAAMANCPAPEICVEKAIPVHSEKAPIRTKWIADSDEEIERLTPQIKQNESTAQPIKRKVIELSGDEQQTMSLKGSKINSATFFKKNISVAKDTAIESKNSFTQRLEDIGISIRQQEVFGMKAIELIYYEQIEEKLYIKFMEEPAALFYKHGPHTYQRTYDNKYINLLLKQRKCDPFTGRAFNEYFLAANPFYKEWLESFIKELEDEHARKVAKYSL